MPKDILSWAPCASMEGVGSLIIVPIFHHREVVGAMEFFYKEMRFFSTGQVMDLELIAGVVSERLSACRGRRFETRKKTRLLRPDTSRMTTPSRRFPMLPIPRILGSLSSLPGCSTQPGWGRASEEQSGCKLDPVRPELAQSNFTTTCPDQKSPGWIARRPDLGGTQGHARTLHRTKGRDASLRFAPASRRHPLTAGATPCPSLTPPTDKTFLATARRRAPGSRTSNAAWCKRIARC